MNILTEMGCPSLYGSLSTLVSGCHATIEVSWKIVSGFSSEFMKYLFKSMENIKTFIVLTIRKVYSLLEHHK